jgi:hypothetical protein
MTVRFTPGGIMARYAVEMFGHLVYSPELSYDDLLSLESDLMVGLTGIIAGQGGEFTHFEAMGDTMRVQCVFVEHGEKLFHSFCSELALLMDGNVEARVLFVDKDLDMLHVYTLNGGTWRECCISLPAPGPLTLAMRDPPAKRKRSGGKSARRALSVTFNQEPIQN